MCTYLEKPIISRNSHGSVLGLEARDLELELHIKHLFLIKLKTLEVSKSRIPDIQCTKMNILNS